jgi:hypothetical protein
MGKLEIATIGTIGLNMRATEILIGIFLTYGRKMNYQKILSHLTIIT